jgi:hypothetical protein
MILFDLVRVFPRIRYWVEGILPELVRKYSMPNRQLIESFLLEIVEDSLRILADLFDHIKVSTYSKTTVYPEFSMASAISSRDVFV